MEWFADLAIRLGLPSGDFYRQIYPFLPWWLLTSAAGGALTFFLWRLLRGRAQVIVAAGAERAGSWRDAAALTTFCVALILCFDGPGLVNGFFRQDDFSFLQVAREPLSLGQQMRLYHNVHPCPLYRVQVWTLFNLAGPDATAGQLAAWFNAVTVTTCLGVLLAGAWLLHEAGAGRLALWVFCFVAWLWPGWGEFTAGYYTIGVYLQVLAPGLAAVATSLRGFRLASARWLASSLLLAALASGLNISGLWVFIALGAFTFFGQWPLATRYSRGYAAALTVVAVATGYILLVAFKHPFSARELVQNPGGHSIPLAENLARHWIDMPLALPSGMGGAVLGMVVPTFLQLGAERVADHTAIRWAIMIAEFTVLLLLGRWLWRRLSQIDTPARSVLFGALTAAATGVLLVITARTEYSARIPGTLWHAKYLAGAVVWLVLAFTLVADRLWFSKAARTSPVAAAVFTLAVFGLWLTASHRLWERELLPMPLTYTARGRWGNTDNALQRRQQYADVMADLQTVARSVGSTRLALPEPTFWGAVFFERHPLLEWGTDYTPQGVTHLFADMPAASRNLDLWVELRPTTSFSPDEQRHLQRCAWLQGSAASKNP